MTEQPPYTDNDCRYEAARQLRRINEQPNGVFPEPLDGNNWADITEPDYDNAIDRVATLMNGAPDMTNWAIDLGADHLEPHERTLAHTASDGRPLLRIHFAFSQETTQENRDRCVEAFAGYLQDLAGYANYAASLDDEDHAVAQALRTRRSARNAEATKQNHT